MSNIVEEKETRERLLKNVKKECKQLMEIAVTKKFINEDNSCITTLCATIESCLLHGLKRRAIGLFKTSTTMSLVQKISKNCEQAKLILELCDDYEKAYCSKNSSNELRKMNSNSSSYQLFSRKIFSTNIENNGSFSSNQLVNGRNFSPTYYKGSNCYRFLWIRIALLNKCLTKIIDSIISEANQFYYPFALLADPVDGPIFSSLLIGPCALEYTQMKSSEHIWNDPNADELIQRHKMHSSGNLHSNSFSPISVYCSQSSNPIYSNQTTNAFNKHKLGLNSSLAKRKASINTAFDDLSNMNLPLNNQSDKCSSAQVNASNYMTSKDQNQSYYQMPISPNASTTSSNHSAKEYVESLHQNSKSQLIYGKNYVIINQREKSIPGYLSLHSSPFGLVLKWTPNQIMNGSNSFDETFISKTKSGYWDYALNIDMNTIVYLHCHQQASEGATIVLVAQDGVQHPPIIFPKGSHLLQFLTCLESGLAPNGQLDPALWNDNGRGKIFPKLPRKTMKKYKSDNGVTNESENFNENENIDLEDDQEDFVFRIINSKSNVSVTTVNSEVPYKKKLEFSLSAGNNTESSNMVNTFLYKNIKNNQCKLSSIFSTLARKNSSLDENQPKTYNFNESLKAPPPSLSSQASIYNSFESSISPSSIVLDKTTTNSLNILSKIGNLQQHPICDIETLSSELNSPDTLSNFRHLSARSSLRNLCDNMKKQILSRAFYGWLAYHRHLKTVTTHLTGLVNNELDRLDQDPIDDECTDYKIDENGFKMNIGKYYLEKKLKLDDILWSKWITEKDGQNKILKNKNYFYRIIYNNGIENNLRKDVWPFLLEHYTIEMNKEQRESKDSETSNYYYKLIEEWKPFEEHINAKDQKKLAASLNNKAFKSSDLMNEKVVQEREKIEKNNENNLILKDVEAIKNKPSTIKTSLFGFSLLKQKPKPLVTNQSIKSEEFEDKKGRLRKDSSVSNDVFIENDSTFSFSLKSLFNKLMSRNLEDAENNSINSVTLVETDEAKNEKNNDDDEFKAIAAEIVNKVLNKIQNDWNSIQKSDLDVKHELEDDECCETIKSGSIYTDTRNGFSNATSLSNDETYHDVETADFDQIGGKIIFFDGETVKEDEELNEVKTPISSERHLSNKLSKQSSLRRTLSNQELIENFALNMHRIDKDVTRCDRNYWYFISNDNLKKLKNIMYTYVWENLNIGYIQGMCDLVAPLLVIFDDEPLTYSCFKQLMNKMSSNFPHGTAMDQHFGNMRTLIQILDSDLFEHMHHRGDYTHFYFSYRWFLLDFKRELVYDDVFSVWETIWSAKYISSAHFHLFIALALVETYRDIIIENNMDFTDIIKFFNEMAEKHNISEILELARNLIKQLQNLIDNKNDINLND